MRAPSTTARLPKAADFRGSNILSLPVIECHHSLRDVEPSTVQHSCCLFPAFGLKFSLLMSLRNHYLRVMQDGEAIQDNARREEKNVRS